MKEKKEKKKREKPAYSLFSNILFMSKVAWKNERSILFSSILEIPLDTAASMMYAYLAKVAVDFIIDGITPQKYVLYIGGLLLLVTFINIISDIAYGDVAKKSILNRFRYTEMWSDKMMELDYGHLESPDVSNLAKRSKGYMGGNFLQMFNNICRGFTDITTIGAFSVLLLALNPLLFILIVGMTALDFYVGTLTNKWVSKNYKTLTKINNKRNYLKSKSASFNHAKDIRLYGMKDWIMSLFKELNDRYIYWFKKEMRVTYAVKALGHLMTLIRDLTGYVFLIFSIANGKISAGDFVFYTGIITQLHQNLSHVSERLKTLNKTSIEMSELRSFLDIPEVFTQDKGQPIPTEAPEIVFENVTFRYPKAEEDTIKNVSFRIEKGEKIALVGRNGAGKTTLVKLICGLYHPTSGKIYVNGHEITDYNKKEYFSLISAVFQDINVMPLSISQNVAMKIKGEINEEKVTQCLIKADLQDKIQSLPNKEQTVLGKSFFEGAIDLSGGEMQKLALARALYKEGKIIVLDEPTAALDPIAEHSMYVKYNELVSGATSVYISHRLASTRFCDRILLLDEGVIRENGTHEELMAKKGIYAEMFDMQSYYYKEEVK